MVAVAADPELIAHYKRLLVSDWQRTFPFEVLDLLWKAISVTSTDAQRESLERLLNPDDKSGFPEQFFQLIIDKIAGVNKFMRLPGLPELPHVYRCPKRMSKSVWVANRLASYLALPAHATIEGNVDFFTDIQALAFQAAVHHVLPVLKEDHAVEHSVLLHAAALFAIGYSTYEPAHYSYMLSIIYDYIDNDKMKLKYLYDSFRFTSPGDHSFLTKAQEIWTELLDRGKHEEAENFLFSLHWSSSPDQKEEVREMFIDAMTQILQDQKRKTSA